jgi:hypothetical protein
MHVLLGLLGSLITILYILDRLGFDLAGMNPFYWRRRRAWAKKYEGDPIYSVEDPIEVAAILIIGVARLEGDLSAEQKRVAQEQFASAFSMDARAAAQLLGSASHLLGAPQVIDAQLDGLIEKNKDLLSTEQSQSMIEMMLAVAAACDTQTARQREYLDKVTSQFAVRQKGEGPWA